MSTTLITNIAALATGRWGEPALRDTAILLDGDTVAAVGADASPASADRVLDAGGLTVIPGLVDGHVHPTAGEWTPAQNSVGWIHNYLHGGTTSMVSAGELHIPGLPFDELTPDLVLGIALTSAVTLGRMRPSGVRVHAGTVLLVPGMDASHFDRIAEAGIRQLKFIFYDWSRLGDGEAQQYVAWAAERDMVVKMHSGGVSRSGSSRVAGSEVVLQVRPNIVGHISGGPIPMPDNEIGEVVRGLPDAGIEVCSSMNYRATQVVVRELRAAGALDRLTLGTDTPGGTGVIPRGMMRNICFLAGVCGMDPVDAVAVGTGNTARFHRIPSGVLEPGAPADLVLLGPVTGSLAADGLEAFALGDLPGIAMVMVGGEFLVSGRSEQTPPPRMQAGWR